MIGAQCTSCLGKDTGFVVGLGGDYGCLLESEGLNGQEGCAEVACDSAGGKMASK